MKKNVCVILLLLASFIVHGQTNFGVKAGYNSSSVQISNSSDWDGKSGFHVGGLAHIHINSKFAVQPELVLSTQGGESGNSKLNLTYVNVPVLLQYMISDGFRLQTGPQIGFLVSAEQKVGNLEIDVDDAYDAVDIAWSFGGSYIFSSGIGVDLRYNLGLNNISDNENYKAKNRVLQAGLFYQFRSSTGRKK